MSCTPQGTTYPNLSLCAPTSGEQGWAVGLNGNWSTLDALFGLTAASASAATPSLLPKYGGLGTNAMSPSNGAIPMGNGVCFTIGQLTGTTREIIVTVASGSITLSLPQTIATTDSPTFTGMTVSNMTVNAITGNVATYSHLSSTGVGVNTPSPASGFAVGPSPSILTAITIYASWFTPSAVAAQTASEQSFTVTGISVTDTLFFNPPTFTNAAMPAYMRPNGPNQVAVGFINAFTGSLTPAAGTYNIWAIRS